MISGNGSAKAPLGIIKYQEGTVQGKWYWVHIGDKKWLPAKRVGLCGWSNEDTWEDFYNEICDWVKIPSPEELI